MLRGFVFFLLHTRSVAIFVMNLSTERFPLKYLKIALIQIAHALSSNLLIDNPKFKVFDDEKARSRQLLNFCR